MSFATLTRSKSDRMISGVCGGIAQKYRFDAVVVRGVFIVLGLVNIGITAIVYVAAIFLIPEEVTAATSGTQRPGWRYDPWTGESLGHAPQDVVIVDSAPQVATNSAQSDPSRPPLLPPAQTRAQERPTDDEV